MNKKLLLIASVGIIIVLGLLAVRTTVTPPKNTTRTYNTTDSEYSAPGLYPNKINNTATKPGLVIKQAVAENNVDAAGKAVSDHIQLTLENTTTTPLSNLEVYYTITDAKTGQKEGYYTALDKLTIPASGSVNVDFDGTSGVGHYPVNKNGLFYSSRNDVTIDIEVSAAEYAVQRAHTTKSAGGADRVD